MKILFPCTKEHVKILALFTKEHMKIMDLSTKKHMKIYFFIFEPFYLSFYQLVGVQSIKGCFRYKWLLQPE